MLVKFIIINLCQNLFFDYDPSKTVKVSSWASLQTLQYLESDYMSTGHCCSIHGIHCALLHVHLVKIGACGCGGRVSLGTCGCGGSVRLGTCGCGGSARLGACR